MRKVPIQVYEILNAPTEPDDWHTATPKTKEWFGGVHYFENIEYEKIEKIAAILGEDFLESRVNDSPSVREFLMNLKDVKEETFFHGVLVSSRRSDARVSIDAVTTKATKENVHFVTHYADIVEKLDNGMMYSWWD